MTASARKLHRGVVGDTIDGRSIEGRFIRNLEAEMIKHIGGEPNIGQRLLIDRVIKIQLQLEAFDYKILLIIR